MLVNAECSDPEVSYNYCITTTLYLMSVLLLQPPKSQSHPSAQFTQSPSLIHLHLLITTEFQAQNFGMGFYRTFLPRMEGFLQLYWRFQVMKDGSLRLNIRPNLANGPAGNLRLDSQRGLVDLLRVISSLNRDKTQDIRIVLSEYSYLELLTTFPAGYLESTNKARVILKSAFKYVPKAVERLMANITQFLDPNIRRPLELAMENTTKTYLDKNLKNLIIARRYQLERKLKKKDKDKPDEQVEEEVLRMLEEEASDAIKKTKDCFSMLALNETIIKIPTGCSMQSTYSEYSEWLNRHCKQRQVSNKKAADKQRNVFSVKIISETAKSLENNAEGTHSRILLCKYKLSILFSMNMETNESMSKLRGKDGQPLIGEVIKELQLVRKEVKNPERCESKNSFENERDFIVFIKDLSCEYVSTYYLQQRENGKDKDPQKMRIIMDYYPHNMTQMLHAQGSLLSFRQKLLLIKRVIEAVDWLSSNYICHRDLKPDNIMLSDTRIPKLVDFGSCCPVNTPGSNPHFKVSDSRLLGSPKYYHPYSESLSYGYKKQDYEQHILFDAYSLGQIMRDVFDDGQSPILPNLTDLMNYVIERCLEKDPADRMTYQEMMYVFHQMLQHAEWQENCAK